MRRSLSGASLILGLCACDLDGPTSSPFQAPDELVVVPNLDDDDQDGIADWEQAGANVDDDRAWLALEADPGMLSLTLQGDARIWHEGEVLLDAEDPEASLDVTGDVLLMVEVPDFLSTASLGIRWSDGQGGAVDHEIAIRGAPLLLNHHLQMAEQVYAMDSQSRMNAAFIEHLTDDLAERFTAFDLSDYSYDPWIQDEIELGTATGPDQRLNVVMDSVRTQGGNYLDALPEAELLRPDTYVHTWGEGQGRSTSQDYGGNIEVMPPLTVDGVHYPFGRIYYGLSEGEGPKQEVRDLFDAQGMQDPFTLDVTFLCVGHVDEFFTTIPDETSARGFRVLYADTELGRSFLEGLDPELELAKYKSAHGFATVGDMLDDQALWSYNEDIQRDYLDPNLDTLVLESGLEPSDVVMIPAVFEENAMCGGYGLSLIPGTVNMEVARIDERGPTHLFMPDPFLREDEDDQGSDPLIAYVEDLLPPNVEAHWLDDWRQYHVAWGEVHCGSNTQRTPVADAWTQAVSVEE